MRTNVLMFAVAAIALTDCSKGSEPESTDGPGAVDIDTSASDAGGLGTDGSDAHCSGCDLGQTCDGGQCSDGCVAKPESTPDWGCSKSHSERVACSPGIIPPAAWECESYRAAVPPRDYGTFCCATNAR